MTGIRFVKFPDNFKLVPNTSREIYPRLIASPHNYYVKLLSQIYPEEWQSLKIKLGREIIYLALSGWKIYKKPIYSPSTESDALYYAKTEIEGFGFLLGGLLPYSHTSSHWHEKRREFYYLIAGKCEVGLNPKRPKLTIPGKSQLIIGLANGPKGVHPVMTYTNPCLLVIQMEGGLDRKDHHYPEAFII